MLSLDSGVRPTEACEEQRPLGDVRLLALPRWEQIRRCLIGYKARDWAKIPVDMVHHASEHVRYTATL